MMGYFLQGPYLLIGIFVLLMGLLLYLRFFLLGKKKEEKSGVFIGNAQIIGKREEQEDSFASISTGNGVLAVLADGIGGYAKGKMASSIVVETFLHEFSKPGNIPSMEDFFVTASGISNSKVLEKARGMKTGTTLVSAVISGDLLYWASMGDSAVILYRKGELLHLNKKHIYEAVLEEQFLSGKITREEMLNHAQKKNITSYIGHRGQLDIEVGERPVTLTRGDKVLLCSDGVYNSISEMELEKVLGKNIIPLEAAEEIIEIIRKKDLPNQDNATLIILEKR